MENELHEVKFPPAEEEHLQARAELLHDPWGKLPIPLKFAPCLINSEKRAGINLVYIEKLLWFTQVARHTEERAVTP